MSRWRLAARLARREVRRHLARSLLVVVTIAVPVLAAQGLVIVGRSHRVVAPHAAWAVQLDPAFVDADESTGFDPRLPHPPPVEGATRVETSFSLRDWVEGTAGHGEGPDDLAQVGVVPYIDEGSEVDLEAGRLPRTRDEVVIGSDLAETTGATVGDAVTLLASDVALEVVGISAPVETYGIRGDDRATTIWVGPSAGDGDDWVPTAVVRIRDSGTTLAVAEMFDLYWHGDRHEIAPDPQVTDTSPLARVDRQTAAEVVTGTAVAAIAVGLVAITCSAAFAVGARRQLRQLGTLAAAGASPADLRRAVLLQGTVLGLVGAGLATVVTYVLRAVLGQRLVDGIHNTDAVLPTDLHEVLGVAVLGVVAGTAAALVPAVTASRIPVLRALAGRRPRAGRRGLVASVAGIAVLAGGLLLLSWSTAEPGGESQPSRGAPVAVAVLLTMAGAASLAPALVVGAATATARVGGTAHLAGRSLARGGLRSSAVVASTAAVLAVPVILLVWTHQRDVEARPEVSERTEALLAYDRAAHAVGAVWMGGTTEMVDPTVARAEAILGPDTVRVVPVLVRDGGGDGEEGTAYAVDPDELRALGEDEVADLLDDGRLVRLDDPTYADLVGPPDIWSPPTDADVAAAVDRPEATVSADDLSAVGLFLLARSGRGVIDDDLAPTPLRAGTQGVIRPTPLTPAEQATLIALRKDPAPTADQVRALHGEATSTVSVDVSGYGDDSSELPWEAIALTVSLLVALAVVSTSLALAAADGRGDDLVVAAVGAPPATVRRRRALEAGLIAACAALLGGGVGALATLVVIHSPGVASDPVSVHAFPFRDVVAVGLGAVVVVGGLTWLALSLADRVRGRRDLVLVDV